MKWLAHFIVLSGILICQEVHSQCCTIIDIAQDSGLFSIRDNKSGRIQAFKPDALEGAELKVGDSIDAKFDSMKVVRVKGVSRSYDLLDPMYSDSCCVVTLLDTLSADSAYKITARNISTGENIFF